MPIQPAIFETHEIRRVYDEETETWWFSVIYIVQMLTQQPDFQAARNYWKVLKNRLAKEDSESVTNCHRLKLPVAHCNGSPSVKESLTVHRQGNRSVRQRVELMIRQGIVAKFATVQTRTRCRDFTNDKARER
jgi:hypothetical protein